MTEVLGPARAAEPAPGDPPPAAAPASRPLPLRGITALLVVLVLTQRIGIPLGENSVSVAIPLVYAGLALLLVRHRLGVSRLRLELLLLALVGVITATVVVSSQQITVSMTSFLLLLVIYVPWVLRLRCDPAQARDGLAHVGRGFVRLMVVLALVGVGQLATQLLGVWRYEDYLLEWLGEDWLVPGYNISIPLVYDSPTYKANAFVILEPSFLSQLCALAVVIGLVLRVRAWQLLILVAGMASSVSGTGIILLAVGALLVVLRAPRALRPGYVVAGLVAVVLVLLSPVAPLLLERSDETTQQGSSGYQRFVQPYDEVLAGLEDEPLRYAWGAGAGTSERLLDSSRGGTQIGQAAVYTTVPKLVFEYGLIAGGLFALFIVVSLLDRVPWRVVPGTLLVMTFFLSGALLQPQTAYLAWLLTAFWTANTDGDGPRSA
ncbi:hypothetical protein [Trujillonella humicola]|uniref:hypothetical protein n=1 Tax=Trujillonella humicola TaxID=3383699 RepID=UPI0039066BFB